MAKISIQKDGITYNKNTRQFYISGKKVRFDSSYEVVNENTGQSVKFDFHHSDGSEWDPKTKWFYHNADQSLMLVVGNDEVTPQHYEAYRKYKYQKLG